MTLTHTSPTTPIAALRAELGQWKFNLLREAAAAAYSFTEIGPKLFMSRASGGTRFPLPAARQPMLRWPVLPPHVTSLQQFVAMLEGREIHYMQGRHTIYIPPQERLSSLFCELVSYYPPNSGFKILKRLGPPETTHYLHDKHARWITARLMGGIRRQVDAANLLYALGLGPRLHDCVELNSPSTQMTCFVVEHVSGDCPTIDEHEAFISKLAGFLSNELHNAVALATPRKLRHRDFSATDCNGNLVRSRLNKRLMYVDFQPFMVIDLCRIVEYLFSTVRQDLMLRLLGEPPPWPSPRSFAEAVELHIRAVSRNWAAIQKLMDARGISVQGRLVLDSACGLGLMLDGALERGARWGIGWTHPDAVECVDRVQCVWGNTRLTLLPAQANPGCRLAETVPTGLRAGLGEAVVLDPAPVEGSCSATDLEALPWRVLIQTRPSGSDSSVSGFAEAEPKYRGRLVAEVRVPHADRGEQWLGMFVRD